MHGEVILPILFNMHVSDDEIHFSILNVYHMKSYLLFFFSLMYADKMESTEGLQIFLVQLTCIKDAFLRSIFKN